MSDRDELARIELEIARVRLQRESLALEEEQQRHQPKEKMPEPASTSATKVKELRMPLISWGAIIGWACFCMAVLWLTKSEPQGWAHVSAEWGFVVVLWAGIGKGICRMTLGPTSRSPAPSARTTDPTAAPHTIHKTAREAFREGMQSTLDRHENKRVEKESHLKQGRSEKNP